MPQPTVAILGASADRGKFGNKSVRAHALCGYRVFPVNPKGGQIEGLDVLRTIADAPIKPLDRVSLYLPPAVAVGVLEDVAAVGCRELWLNPGCDSREVVQKARELRLNTIVGCSIVALGVSVQDLAD